MNERPEDRSPDATESPTALVEEIARDVGRLRRRFASNESAWTAPYVVDRLAGHVSVLDAMLQPTAATIFRANLAFGADEALAVECALEDVALRDQHLRALLGGEWGPWRAR